MLKDFPVKGAGIFVFLHCFVILKAETMPSIYTISISISWEEVANQEVLFISHIVLPAKCKLIFKSDFS